MRDTLIPTSAFYGNNLESFLTKPDEGEDLYFNKQKTKNKHIDNLEIVVLGLSHHNAKVDVREKLAIPEAQWNEASAALCAYDSIAEASVLSTCNRFEIYISGPNQYEAMRDALDYLHKRSGGTVDLATLKNSMFMLSGDFGDTFQ